MNMAAVVADGDFRDIWWGSLLVCYNCWKDHQHRRDGNQWRPLSELTFVRSDCVLDLAGATEHSSESCAVLVVWI